MTSEQQVSLLNLVRSADDAALTRLVPESARVLLNVLGPSTLEGSGLRKLVMGARDARDYLLDADARPVVFGLLNAVQARSLCARLGISLTGPSPDPHAALLENSAALTSEQLDEVASFFGAAHETERTSVRFEPLTRSVQPSYGLFAHQRAALDRTQRQLYTGSRRVILHMPTGAGKTRTSMNLIAEHLRSRSTVVVWLATSEELLEQAAAEFQIAWSFLGNRPVSVTRFWGARNPDLLSVEDGLVVAGLGKLYAMSRRDLNSLPALADVVSLVVVDEAHQSVAETYAYVIELLALKRPDTSLLGLTATPGRSYSEIEQDARLSRFWDGNKVLLEVAGYDNPVNYLISDGYLARPKFRTVLAAPGLSLSHEDIEWMSKGLDLPASVLEQLSYDKVWNAAIVETTRELLTRHARVIVFATSVNQATTLAAVLRALDCNARAITGETPKSERASVLQQYGSNSTTPMALLNYGVLTTGFDAPRTSAAVVARPTKSLVLYSQMIGRALRGPRAGGNASAEIVTVLDPSLPGFGDPAEAFANWEDVW